MQYFRFTWIEKDCCFKKQEINESAALAFLHHYYSNAHHMIDKIFRVRTAFGYIESCKDGLCAAPGFFGVCE